MTTCLNCNVAMKPLKNGALIQENFEDGRPYKIWMADTYRCERCRSVVATGFASTPLWQHFESATSKPPEEVIAGYF